MGLSTPGIMHRCRSLSTGALVAHTLPIWSSLNVGCDVLGVYCSVLWKVRLGGLSSPSIIPLCGIRHLCGSCSAFPSVRTGVTSPYKVLQS